MRFSNKFNLPEALVQAVIKREYSKGEADYSVTELLRPPQMARLLKLYGGQIEVDVADSIWAVLGTAVHYILSKNEIENHTVEQRYTINLGGITISGQPDVLLDNNGSYEIQDYKYTSTYKVLNKDYYDWEFQLNTYKFILESQGKKINKLSIISILRDWSRNEKKKAEKEGREYPEVQIHRIDIPIWSQGKLLKELGEKIENIEKAHLITDLQELSEKYPCSPEDRWAQKDAYLVIKSTGYVYRRFECDGTEAGKMTSKLLAEEAYNNLKTNSDYEVKFVEGYSIRCEEYCPVKDFCFQRNGKKPEVELTPEPIISYFGGVQ